MKRWFYYFKSLALFKILIALLIISLFFPIRHVFYSQSAYITGAYSDFTSFSLYISDILILLMLIYTLLCKRQNLKPSLLTILIFFIVIISLLVHYEQKSGIINYFAIKFFEFLILYEIVRATWKPEYTKFILKEFTFLGLIQAIISFFQFTFQSSIGLYKFGESHLSPLVLGVAKIDALGLKFIRPYGTFPHSNLLSAFLVTTSLATAQLLLNAQNKKGRIIYSVFLLVQIFALFMSFSRAGIIAIAFGLGLLFIASLAKNFLNKRKILTSGFLCLVFVLVSIFLLKPFLITRATVSDSASRDRLFYNHIGLQMIKSQPIRGFGLGLSVLHMKQNSPVPLQSWEIQPIHNFYLISTAELGLLGGLLIIIFFIWHIWRNLKLFLERDSGIGYELLFGCLLTSYMVLMFFDHYFYTIEQTQILLWLVLGIAASMAAMKNSSLHNKVIKEE